MSKLKVCRICLRTEAKMYHFNLFQLKFYYEEVMALKLNEEDGLPHYFCYECATILHKFHKFKEKCYSGQKLLKELLWKGPITYESVYKIDRDETFLKSPISVITYTECVKTVTKDSNEIEENCKEETKVIEKIEPEYLSEESLSDGEDLNQDGFSNDGKVFEDVLFEEANIKVDENDEVNEKTVSNNTKVEKIDIESTSPKSVYVESDKRTMKIKCEDIKHKKKREVRHTKGEKVVLEEKHWQCFVLSEEDALKDFRAKAENKKYLEATFKCSDCYKTFSKKDMLDRHTQLRHVESLGSYECRFCRMRFKLDCHLTRHIRQHYARFRCLLCQLTCSTVTSASLHNDYHRGITKKCKYCDEEFRHTSTYYTHLRTHRSEHVCTLCGASFVSHAGLRQHKHIKHIIYEIESPDDDEEVNTYCERCNIRFDTRKAYEEHLFHSALHTDADGSDETLEQSKKILGKKEQAKITKGLRRRKPDEDVFKIINAPKRRKTPRVHKKPTTCYQCGKHFNTQAKCWKHHLAEHPRTSFCPPNERYICEICGASLAPGSIANHQNIHSRDSMFPCNTCGKQFTAMVGLRRHQVTHTGEKPYACPLCDKRFTQNNSMKLHYRTIHLKQPYPKRNRRKNKDEPKTKDAEDSNSEDSEESLPELESAEGKAGSDALAKEDDMHFLTLA